ncbi:MAG: AtpZ/AtpI family protein [SAR202 cluster bacterium]|nr:AtpZ/AtpI family protein [SAR202 cluster bacterium]MQG67837.1 AtpZ/AtpI family protein [SAR202 cluster bacterium]
MQPPLQLKPLARHGPPGTRPTCEKDRLRTRLYRLLPGPCAGRSYRLIPCLNPADLRVVDPQILFVIHYTSFRGGPVMNGRKMELALRLLGIGWFVAICIGGGAVGGYMLDRQLELSPLMTLLGIGGGIALAVTGMVRMLMAVISAESDET